MIILSRRTHLRCHAHCEESSRATDVAVSCGVVRTKEHEESGALLQPKQPAWYYRYHQPPVASLSSTPFPYLACSHAATNAWPEQRHRQKHTLATQAHTPTDRERQAGDGLGETGKGRRDLRRTSSSFFFFRFVFRRNTCLAPRSSCALWCGRSPAA